MAIIVKALIQPKYAENSQTTQYTASNVRAIIDKFTVTNIGSANYTISINIVDAGDSAGAYNLITDARTVAPGESYTCPELVGHVIDSGSFISTIASDASSLTIYCSGREVT